MSQPSRQDEDALTSAVEEYLASQRKAPGGTPATVMPVPMPSADAPQSGGGIRAAYEQVLRQEAEKLAPATAERPSLWQQVGGPLIPLLLAFAAGYVWIGKPAFLRPPPPTELPVPRTELMGSRQLVAVALQIEDFRRSTGRLPEHLAVLGLSIPHLTYTVLPAGSYVLRTRVGQHALVYRAALNGKAELREEVAP